MIFDSRNSLQRSFGHSAMRRIPYASATCNILTFSPLGNENVTPKNVLILLPPENDVCEGYVFTGVCLPTGGGGMRGGGRACVVGAGGMRGRGACVVGRGVVWHAWQKRRPLHPTGMHSCCYIFLTYRLQKFENKVTTFTRAR